MQSRRRDFDDDRDVMAKTKAKAKASKAATKSGDKDDEQKPPHFSEYYRGETVSIRGSVMEILDDGAESGTWRALMRLNSGAVTILNHSKALPAQPGDDLFLTGRFYLSGAKSVPDEFQLAPEQPAERLEAMRKSGAKIKHFGKDESALDQRPGTKMWKAAKARGLTVVHAHPAATVVQAATTSTDPAIAWGAKLFAGMHRNHAVVMFNPLAFPPSPKSIKPGSKAAERRDAKFASQIRTALPASHQSLANTDWVKRQVGFPGRSSTWSLPGPATAHKLLNIVNPYSPNRSTAATMAGYAALPADDFAPKTLLNPMTRKCFTVSHELAHSVQMYYGIKRPGVSPTHDSHRAECFADSFATFAIMQHLDDADGLEMISNMRHAALMSITPTHVTGRAMDEALKRAKKMKRKGTLAKMTADDMAKQAAEITAEFAYTPKQINRIVALRDEFYRDNFVRIEKLNAKRNGMILMKYDKVEAWRLMKRAVRDRKTKPMKELTPFFAASLKAIGKIAYTPDDLDKPATRKKAMKLYEQDLTRTMALDAQDRWFALDVMRSEQQLMVTNPQTPRKAYVQRKRHAKLAESRAQVLKRFGKAHGLTKKSGRPAKNTHTPATLIRPASDAKGRLGQWFALPAEKRFELYKQSVAQEHVAFEKWQEEPKNLKYREIFQQCRIRRGQIATSIRADRAVWAARRDYAGPKLIRDISQTAGRMITVLTGEKPIEIYRTRLRRSLKRSGLKSPRKTPATAKTDTPEAPKPGA
ncbi:MAG: hypothetical protein Alpg2KO_06110 [Alphaproteobacteria bacterium]